MSDIEKFYLSELEKLRDNLKILTNSIDEIEFTC